MTSRDPMPLRAILHAAIARYLTVTERGLILVDRAEPVPSVVVRILAHVGARTLYRSRRPSCRSLDGVRSITSSDKLCATCPQLAECTPQVRVDIVLDQTPYRLLLAFTSARNFLAHVGRLEAVGVQFDRVQHRIDVIPRRGWGELRFREAP